MFVCKAQFSHDQIIQDDMEYVAVLLQKCD